VSYPVYPDGAELDNTTPTPDGSLGWWMVLGSLPNMIPACDLRPHILGGACRCQPMDGDEIVSHNALDRREQYQQHGARPH